MLLYSLLLKVDDNLSFVVYYFLKRRLQHNYDVATSWLNGDDYWHFAMYYVKRKRYGRLQHDYDVATSMLKGDEKWYFVMCDFANESLQHHFDLVTSLA